MRASRERGSATLELAVLAPGLLVLLGLVVAAGRVQLASGAIEQAAAAAARAASIARDARSAEAAAESAAHAALSGESPACLDLSVDVDVTGFALAPAEPASVTAEVTCRVALADLAVPGLPGQRSISAVMTSPLDTFRGRST